MSKYYVIMHQDEVTTTIQDNLGYSISSGVIIFDDNEEPTEFVILPVPDRVAHQSLQTYRKFTSAEVKEEITNVVAGVVNNKISSEQGLPTTKHPGITARWCGAGAKELPGPGTVSMLIAFPFASGYLSGMETIYDDAQRGDTLTFELGTVADEVFTTAITWCHNWNISGDGKIDEGDNFFPLTDDYVIRVTLTKPEGNGGTTWFGCNARFWNKV